jgi:hypothetical protein
MSTSFISGAGALEQLLLVHHHQRQLMNFKTIGGQTKIILSL